MGRGPGRQTQDGIVAADVLRVHRENPSWGAARIARELHCVSGYVRATLKRHGIDNPNKRLVRKPKKVFSRGDTEARRTAPSPLAPPPTRETSKPATPWWVD